MQRVLVVGMSGSGGTTAARRLAGLLAAPFHELDAMAIGPGWSTPPTYEDDVRALVAGPRWVVDSWGAGTVRELLFARADTVVWLDYPRHVVWPRLPRRSLRRTLTREPVFGGNVEGWRDWLRPDHPVWWAVRTFERRRRQLAALTAQPHLRAVRLRSPAELDRWLARPDLAS